MAVVLLEQITDKARYVWICPHCKGWVTKDDNGCTDDRQVVDTHYYKRTKIDKAEPCRVRLPLNWRILIIITEKPNDSPGKAD